MKKGEKAARSWLEAMMWNYLEAKKKRDQAQRNLDARLLQWHSAAYELVNIIGGPMTPAEFLESYVNTEVLKEKP